VAEQDTSRGKQEIFHLTASFKKASQRTEDIHQVGMAHVPPPHGLPEATARPPVHVHPGVIALLSDLSGVLDARYVPNSQGATQVWFRVKGLAQEDVRPALHHILLAYLSDLTLLDSASPHHRTHSPNSGSGSAVSLDHAMWFHRPARADEWLLYEQTSPSFADGRALAHARIYTADGLLAGSVVQEGVMRLGRDARTSPAVADLVEEDIDPFSWAVAKPETD
jgi:acyl-CoA thioesterase-2